jgi:hypothetical protein
MHPTVAALRLKTFPESPKRTSQTRAVGKTAHDPVTSGTPALSLPTRRGSVEGGAATFSNASALWKRRMQRINSKTPLYVAPHGGSHALPSHDRIIAEDIDEAEEEKSPPLRIGFEYDCNY